MLKLGISEYKFFGDGHYFTKFVLQIKKKCHKSKTLDEPNFKEMMM